ncbi:uncharacterized protein EI90DRAFT_2920002 [Cantharellus anzutake]|uniref:uncharacterized protein n=1 Tax=Cantharellus anzutake TaxID=1750568 RepID=UPI001902CDF8|nr:uncharacterized protein EI90DRAFT_2920002 [Cantharellus anzutake]KAF8331654.1 hypothetical protein EI90DRAFT_2920002 [Cantharellus anzutake]
MATALITFLLAHTVYSAPISPHNAASLPPNISHTCSDLRDCRTMWSIIYACLSTILACIWTAVHPDIPGGSRKTWMFKSTRIGLTMISLVLPEYILMIAWEDFLNSWRISKKCETVQGWTFTHSYFVAMGGFLDPSQKAVKPMDLQLYPGIIGKSGKVAITQEQILDRNKGDPFTKLFIVLQLLWFITQYVGRWVGHLHRSQLETMTLAYAALFVIVYMLWWYKPLNIRFPIQVTNESPTTSPRPVPETKVAQLKPKRVTDAMLASAVKEVKDKELIWIFLTTGIVFGGIHCSAWSFPFPTSTERLLWRISAIIITVAPVFIVLGIWIASNAVGLVIVFTGSFSYAAARVILLVLTFAPLRSPPPDLYRTPSWSSFLPHFG